MPPPHAPPVEINALIAKLKSVADEIHHHASKMTTQDFKRLLFRTASALITIPESSELMQEFVALPFVAFTSSSIAAGIEAWTWLIGERPDLEISLMTDISEAWAETIKLRKGLFSTSMKYVFLSCLTNLWLTSSSSFDDPFNHPVEYSATDKALIDRMVATGKKLLGPHTQVLRMLLSRFQAVRYRRPGLMLLITRLVLRTTRNHKSFR
jgi:phosphatidylinositol 4-kinase